MSLGLRVDIVANRYREMPIPHCSPRELAITHARGKAAGATAAVLLVAADTVVDLDGVALGKPQDRAEARAMLGRLAGRTHTVHTAFALRTPDGRSTEHCESARVRFGSPPPATLDAYAHSGDGLDKAGAYGIQGFAATLVDGIDGDYFAVVGLPLAAFARALPHVGYELLPLGVEAEQRA